MKTPASRRRDGFTLVELLVVIAIIAVLAAAGFAAGTAAINKARKVTCLNQATGIEQAVNGFVTDYGYMPDNATADNTPAIDTSKDTKLLTVLLGLEDNSGTPLNTRGVKYLVAKEGKKQGNKGIGGLIYSGGGTSITGLYDPWGGGYLVMLDLDFDDKVNPPIVGNDPPSRGPLMRKVAVWSGGGDKVAGGNKKADDVKTWN